jgi:hypothetical protein
LGRYFTYMMTPLLEALLSDLVLLQGYLDLKDRSEPDDIRQTHIRAMISDARNIILPRLRELSAMTPARLRMSLGAFKDTVTNLMLTGLAPSKVSFDAPIALACLKHGSLFSTFGASGERYIYEFVRPLDVLSVQSVSSDQLLDLLFSDVLQSAENDDNYLSKLNFDHQVFMKVASLLYAIESAGGRFGREEDGGQDNDAAVPRVPMPPRLIDEAEEPLPEIAVPAIEVVGLAG